MTRIRKTRTGRTIVQIEAEAAAKCEDCGVVAELRPYGPGNTNVCFDCMQKDEEGAKARFAARLRGETNE